MPVMLLLLPLLLLVLVVAVVVVATKVVVVVVAPIEKSGSYHDLSRELVSGGKEAISNSNYTRGHPHCLCIC